MADFYHKRNNILVCTTIIETGIDIPSANTIIIDRADKFGLAQLHQLRGRVGRGARISFCILLAGDSISQQSRERLSLLKTTNDGFELAEADLRLRGPGDVTGTRQTGELSLKVADLSQHAHLLDQIASLAETIRLNHGEARDQLIERWSGREEDFVNV